jgi:hypothetical protein
MASFVTNRGARDLSKSTSGTAITWSSDTIKARLVASSVTPNKDDTAMTGYTMIGTDVTLSNKTFTEDTTNDRIVYDNTVDPTWSAVAGGSTIGWVVVYKFVTDDAGSTPIFVIDVTDTPTNGSDITIQFDSAGIGYTQQ